jgi:hypothetical protein
LERDSSPALESEQRRMELGMEGRERICLSERCMAESSA